MRPPGIVNEREHRGIRFVHFMSLGDGPKRVDMYACQTCGTTIMVMNEVNGDLILRTHARWHQYGHPSGVEAVIRETFMDNQ